MLVIYTIELQLTYFRLEPILEIIYEKNIISLTGIAQDKLYTLKDRKICLIPHKLLLTR